MIIPNYRSFGGSGGWCRSSA